MVHALVVGGLVLLALALLLCLRLCFEAHLLELGIEVGLSTTFGSMAGIRKGSGTRTPVRNCMKLKNGTHISGGKNCCAKTVYTGDVIHVICQFQSRHFML